MVLDGQGVRQGVLLRQDGLLWHNLDRLVRVRQWAILGFSHRDVCCSVHHALFLGWPRDVWCRWAPKDAAHHCVWSLRDVGLCRCRVPHRWWMCRGAEWHKMMSCGFRFCLPSGCCAKTASCRSGCCATGASRRNCYRVMSCASRRNCCHAMNCASRTNCCFATTKVSCSSMNGCSVRKKANCRSGYCLMRSSCCHVMKSLNRTSRLVNHLNKMNRHGSLPNRTSHLTSVRDRHHRHVEHRQGRCLRRFLSELLR